MLLKNKIARRVALVISFIMLLTSTVNTTYGYIVTKTDSVVNTFTPPESDDSGFVPPVPDTEDIVVNIAVEKAVKNTGTASISPEGFEFMLENTASGEKITLKTDANGKTLFTLPFTVEDAGKTFAYKLSEIDKGMNGVTYDKRVYDIHVTVTLDGNNKLIAGVTVDGKIVTNAVAKFENTYYGEKPNPPQTGDNSNTAFWFLMMFVSGTACIVLVVLDKRYMTK